MPRLVALKDPYRESRIFAARTALVVIGVVVTLIVVLMHYYSLQITQYELYRTESEKNRVQLQPLPPKRGLIYDKNGLLLAENRPSYLLSIIKERVPQLLETL